MIESSEVWFRCPRKKMDQNVVTWNATCPIFLGNLTPKTSNYCLKNRSRKLIYPNLWLGETTHWSEAWILNSWDIQAGISIRDVWTTWMGGDNVKYVFFCSSFVGGNDPILIIFIFSNPVKTNGAGWKITMFDRIYIFDRTTTGASKWVAQGRGIDQFTPVAWAIRRGWNPTKDVTGS